MGERMRSKTKLVVALVGALLVIGCTAAVAVPLPSPDPCDALVTGSMSTTKLQKYEKCRLDRIEKAIPGNQTVTVTAPPVTQTVRETVTVTAEPTAPTPLPVTTPPPTSEPPVTTPPVTTAPTTTQPPTPGGFVALGRTFPNEDTTGVPPGTQLTPYTGPCLIQQANQVIDSKTINCGEMRVFAKNLTIKNSVVNGVVYVDYNANEGSFTITDSEVRIGNERGTGLGDAFFTAERVEVTGGSRSINCYAECTVKDSYVHGQYTDLTGRDHESGIRVNTNSHLIHNTIGCTAEDVPPDAGCSAAITGYPDFDPVQGNVIENNLILASSGGYCAYGGSTAGKPFSGQTRNITFRDNIWQRGTEMGDGGRGYVCGWWGPITSFDSNAPGAVWTNNLYDDGTPVAPAN